MTGLLLVVWQPTLPVPRHATPAIGTLAAASLAIYLVHWQVYPPLLHHGPTVAAAGSLLIGAAAWSAWQRFMTAAHRLPMPRARHRPLSTAWPVPCHRPSG